MRSNKKSVRPFFKPGKDRSFRRFPNENNDSLKIRDTDSLSLSQTNEDQSMYGYRNLQITTK